MCACVEDCVVYVLACKRQFVHDRGPCGSIQKAACIVHVLWPSIVHKLAFVSMEIYITQFSAHAHSPLCILMDLESIHKLELPSVDKRYMEHCACERSSEVQKLAFPSKNIHYPSFYTCTRTSVVDKMVLPSVEIH